MINELRVATCLAIMIIGPPALQAQNAIGDERVTLSAHGGALFPTNVVAWPTGELGALGSGFSGGATATLRLLNLWSAFAGFEYERRDGDTTDVGRIRHGATIATILGGISFRAPDVSRVVVYAAFGRSRVSLAVESQSNRLVYEPFWHNSVTLGGNIRMTSGKYFAHIGARNMILLWNRDQLAQRLIASDPRLADRPPRVEVRATYLVSAQLGFGMRVR